MSTSSKLIAVMILCFFVISCINEESNLEIVEDFETSTIDYDNAFENRIGVVSSLESNKFVDIEESQLYNYWRRNLELNDKTIFQKTRLVKAEIEDGEEQYYMLNTVAENNGVYMNINTKVSLTKDGFLIGGETCVCESSGCDWGCEVLSMCKCSGCGRGGVCKKKHTLTTKPELRMFDKF